MMEGGQVPVSIPFWVFSRSRHGRVVDSVFSNSLEFQSRSGFSPGLDGIALRAALRGPPGFNPVLGFLPVSTPLRPTSSKSATRFQSRSGFSPGLDSRSRTETPVICTCFNPVLGFLPVSTGNPSQGRGGLSEGFNPVLGFLPVSTGDSGRDCRRVRGFQSRSGFSPGLDVACECCLFRLY